METTNLTQEAKDAANYIFGRGHITESQIANIIQTAIGEATKEMHAKFVDAEREANENQILRDCALRSVDEWKQSHDRIANERDQYAAELAAVRVENVSASCRWERIERIIESPGCVVRFTFRNYKERADDKDFIYFSTNLLDDPKGRGNTAAEVFDNAIK